MGWSLATADESRFKTYFPSVELRTPSNPCSPIRNEGDLIRTVVYTAIEMDC